jgi:hypothetical protein
MTQQEYSFLGCNAMWYGTISDETQASIIFYLEDGSIHFLQNTGTYIPDYMASHPEAHNITTHQCKILSLVPIKYVPLMSPLSYLADTEVPFKIERSWYMTQNRKIMQHI